MDNGGDGLEIPERAGSTGDLGFLASVEAALDLARNRLCLVWGCGDVWEGIHDAWRPLRKAVMVFIHGRDEWQVKNILLIQVSGVCFSCAAGCF